MNYQLRVYILRYFDADAGQAAPVSIDHERALGLRLVELGKAVQDRAVQRKARARQDPVIDRATAQSRAHEPGRNLDDGP